MKKTDLANTFDITSAADGTITFTAKEAGSSPNVVLTKQDDGKATAVANSKAGEDAYSNWLLVLVYMNGLVILKIRYLQLMVKSLHM